MTPPRATLLHASTVSFHGRAALILGVSGAGKSSLALDLMSRGAGLVADDQTSLQARDDVVIASAPPSIRGQIEARGIGILAADYAGPAPVMLVVDLDIASHERLPKRLHRSILGIEIDLISAGGLRNLAPAILLYLKGDRVA